MTNFAYDGENRLVAANGAHNVQMQYDPLGRLARTTGAASTTEFLYDGDELVAEYDAAGTGPPPMLRRYVHGTGSDDPVASFDGPDLTRPRHLFTDHQGSIVAITDGAGNMLAVNAYDAWGIPNQSNAGTFGYTGQAWIPELGMWHYKARIYSPTLGRFLQTDPVGYDDQVNLYAYVGNDPVNHTDPTGSYACGSGMGVARCGAFLAAQNEALSRTRSSISALQGLRSRLSSGTRLTAGDRQVQAHLNRYLGPNAGSSTNVISRLIGTANSMVGMMTSNIPANMHAQVAGQYLSTPANDPRSQLRIYPTFFSISHQQRAQSIAHDAHHGGTGSRDTSWNDIGPRGERNAVRRAAAANNPVWVMTNPDAATMALGFTRDDD